VRLYPEEAAKEFGAAEPPEQPEQPEEPADPEDAKVITDPSKQKLKWQ
jgi:hypothetical protein